VEVDCTVTTIQDDDGWYFTTDDQTHVWGYGCTPEKSVQEYNEAADEYRRSGIFVSKVTTSCKRGSKWWK